MHYLIRDGVEDDSVGVSQASDGLPVISIRQHFVTTYNRILNAKKLPQPHPSFSHGCKYYASTSPCRYPKLSQMGAYSKYERYSGDEASFICNNFQSLTGISSGLSRGRGGRGNDGPICIVLDDDC